ncbi:MAG: DUF86 domain-containing protein [Burkholderiaceae bacterium]|nr:DUF86 domain-containing protein [Burkholderiaceae bacterium]
MPPEDRVRLLHMIEAANEAIGFVADSTRFELEQDRKTLFAVIRCVEIIGEAAAKISEATRSSAPEIPWVAIVGMRNRLVHAYFDVDIDVVWKTVTVELPALKARLEALL